MQQLIQAVLQHPEEVAALRDLIEQLSVADKRYFLRNEILQRFGEYCHDQQKPAYFFHSSSLGKLIHYDHELILEEGCIWLVLRPWIGSQQVFCLDRSLTTAQLMPPSALLDARDRLVNRPQSDILEIDLSSFYENAPSLTDPRSIGQGAAFLNRYIAGQIANDPNSWLETLHTVLHSHEHDGLQLMINDRIASGEVLAQQVKQAIKFLGERSRYEPYTGIHTEMQELGFEPGWGNTAGRSRESLELLDRMITSPEPVMFEAFVARFPAVFRVAVVSIHGWVGQQDIVLGLPETMGQVVYVLEQTRNLEKQLHEDIRLAGLDFFGIKPQVVLLTRLIPNCEGTQCSVRVEQVEGTQNAWIVRVPFREFNSQVTDNWISKFEIFPYLEPFAEDAEADLLKHLGGRPNLIIGNYTDGNLVAFLLARRLQVTHCHIAHVLEKPKYLFSNLYWQDLESQYHFSAQFTADLINMNAADFIVTSSIQEVVGTPETLGQYESYKHFTMPNLYHVVDGIDLFSPKFNRVPPGVDETFFFPYSEIDRRPDELRQHLNQWLFEKADPNILGSLSDQTKKPILAIAPMNGSKNLVGLAECFARSKELRDRCNLIIVTNKIHVADAFNSEEADYIRKLHEVIDQFDLCCDVRWIGQRLSVRDLGEAYRSVADRGGIFVHFARFEAFGRVILESMISGLPTFATEFGGPSEIIEDQKHGFLINPTDEAGSARKILSFLEDCDADPEHWQAVSDRGVQRVRDEYNWTLHTKQLLLLSKLYSFWNYVQRDRRASLLRYLELIFHLIYKPRAATILQDHMSRE